MRPWEEMDLPSLRCQGPPDPPSTYLDPPVVHIIPPFRLLDPERKCEDQLPRLSPATEPRVPPWQSGTGYAARPLPGTPGWVARVFRRFPSSSTQTQDSSQEES